MLTLRSASRRTTRRLLAVVGALTLSAVLAMPAHAAPPPPPPKPDIAVGAGICVVAGTVTQTFSPSVGAVPTTLTDTIIGTGTCVGNSTVTTVTFSLGGSVLLSCAGGEGSLGGNVSFSNGFPPFSTVSAQYLGGPESEQVDILGGGFVAIADLAWSPTSSATCPVSGTTSTPLFGSLVYAYE